jgi:hypothetical protein
MTTTTHGHRTEHPIGESTWIGLVVAGLVLLVAHNAAWASAWVTAVALSFVAVVVAFVVVRVLHRR